MKRRVELTSKEISFLYAILCNMDALEPEEEALHSVLLEKFRRKVYSVN